jgi:uncharacterized membrane protein YbhN (UPF0104 family)
VRARLIAAARLALGLGLVALLLWWLLPGPDDRRALLERATLMPVYLPLGLAATLVASVVTSARWQRMAEDAMGGTRLPWLVYFHALVLTRVLGQVSSTLVMDLVGRGVALRSAGSQRGLGHSVTQAVLERIFDLVLPLLMLAWALAVWRGASPTAALLGFCGVCLGFAGLAVVLLAPLTRLALGLLETLRTWFAARARRPAPEPAPPVPPVPRRLALSVGLLSLARYLAVLLQFWAVAAAVGLDLDALRIAVATPVGQLAGMIGVTPGALGIQEAGWLGGLRWVGLDAPGIAVFVLCQRLIVTANFAALALLSWLLLRRRRAARTPGA